jgi:hypothetical protein
MPIKRICSNLIILKLWNRTSKRVFELSRKLPKISKGQSNYAKVIALNTQCLRSSYCLSAVLERWIGTNYCLRWRSLPVVKKS